MLSNEIQIVVIIFLLGAILIWYIFKNIGNKKQINAIIPETSIIKTALEDNVSFFTKLDSARQKEFLERVHYFLATTKISPEKGAIVTGVDRILVAASATIPLFHYHKWSYENLDEVLIYPGGFNDNYAVDQRDNFISGMVGSGVMNRKMIISLNALTAGFSHKTASNTAIHEFVHLIDKADGDIDGVPSYLIPKELIKPWLQEMHQTIQAIRHDRSDIRDYAATNEAEFLAVVSEYFFQKPAKLKDDHPELYSLLEEIYQNPSKQEIATS